MRDLAEPLAVFEALSWLCANHPDRKIKERAYEFSVALEWNDRGGGDLIDTATLQSWQERGQATDLDLAADRFVEVVEDMLLRKLSGSRFAQSLRGVIGRGFSKSPRSEKVANLREASHSSGDEDPELGCYRDYASCRDNSDRERWLCAAALAVGIRRASGDDASSRPSP